MVGKWTISSLSGKAALDISRSRKKIIPGRISRPKGSQGKDPQTGDSQGVGAGEGQYWVCQAMEGQPRASSDCVCSPKG